MTEEAIPRLVHFIKVDSRFGFLDWVAVMAARKMVKPEKILIFSAGELNSCWWNHTKPFVTHIILPKQAWVTKLNNRAVTHPAHKSDFLRATLVYHFGGMYMDNDVVAVKPFDPLLNNQVVLSRQHGGTAANGLLMARKHSCFMCHFARLGCQRYDGAWSTHSVLTLNWIVDHELGKFHDVTVLPFEHGFFQFGWNYNDLRKLFELDMDSIKFNISDVYSLHYSNHVIAQFRKYFRDKNWLFKSSTAGATAIRMSLPADFNATDLDEKVCRSSSV